MDNLVSAYDDEAWRYCSPQYDPTSGEGAARAGGRFNPPDVDTLYLCTTKACSVAEYRKKLAERRQDAIELGHPALMPDQNLYKYHVRLCSVLDLTSRETREALGVSVSDLTQPDRETPQGIGATAYDNNVQAVLSWSATGQDKVLAVYTDHAKAGISYELVEYWPAVLFN